MGATLPYMHRVLGTRCHSSIIKHWIVHRICSRWWGFGLLDAGETTHESSLRFLFFSLITVQQQNARYVKVEFAIGITRFLDLSVFRYSKDTREHISETGSASVLR
jgi:hypothetical protein